MSDHYYVTQNNKGISNQISRDHDFYKSIIENNSFYIIKTDLNGNYTYLNPFFCKMLGIKMEDWLGKNSLSVIIPEDHEACIETVKKCFSQPNKTHWVVLRKSISQEVISTQWEFKMLSDHHANPIEILCIGHDITPLIRKQQELQNQVEITAEQNNRLVNFTNIVSHNIRSHVSNILGIINIGELDDREERKEIWNLLQECAGNLDETLHNLNDIISIQSKKDLPFSYLNIQHEIKRIVKSVYTIVIEANTTINYNFNFNKQLYTNPAYFESIILNLLTNSLKYKCPNRPLKIDIDLMEEDKFLVLVFKDNGRGIDLSKYKHEMFGMYKTFHGNKNAHGLGLYIIKTQLEAMRGKIKVESEVGETTTFKLYFHINA